MKGNSSQERYSRQTRLKEFGEEGQQKLLRAKVLVIGAGGLGCPVLQYLAAAGVGTIGIIDDDIVTLNNLHRQILYTTEDIGLSKVERATAVLHQMNPGVNIIAYNERLTTDNALDIFPVFDVIIDGTDNFSTRYLVNDACVLLNKPLVFGAVSQFEGQVAIFNGQREEEAPANYRDLFPDQPGEGEVPNCAEAGVLGVLTGIIGSLMANETIKLITGIGEPLINRLVSYDALTNQTYQFILTAKEETKALAPSNSEEFRSMYYGEYCATQGIELSVSKFDRLLNEQDVAVIDVREKGEMPVVSEFSFQSLPISVLKDKAPLIEANTIILFCQAGQRSLWAARYLTDVLDKSKKIYSLRGGIVQWKIEHLQKESV